VAGIGDVNGDGYADVIVGAFRYSAGESAEGAAFVFHGSADGIGDGDPTTAAAQLESDQEDSSMGFTVSGAGDVNGDGYADVLVSAWRYDAGEADEGAVFVFHGSATGIADGNPNTASAQLESNQAFSIFGGALSKAGDVNGDGYGDVIVGAGGYNSGQIGEGSAFVFHGSASGIGDGNPSTADAHLESNLVSANFGRSVSGAGDVNGDGYADVIVGAPHYGSASEEGSAFVFHGSATGIADGNPATAAAQLDGDQYRTRFGISVSGAGDVNGDGFADVIVGSFTYNLGQLGEGAAFIFHGNASGRPVLALQRRDDSSAVPVRPWGSAYDPDSFELSMNATHPEGRGRVKLEVEVCPTAVAFADTSCATQIGSAWTDVTATPGGVALVESITPPAAAVSLYRWRSRVLYAPFGVIEAGITEPPNPPHGPWRRLAGQEEEADIRVVPEPGALLGLASGIVLLIGLAQYRRAREDAGQRTELDRGLGAR
jgi:hypothetical protein